MTAEDIVALSGQFNDGLLSDLEYRNRIALAITELNEAETDLLAGLIVYGWSQFVGRHRP